MFSCYSVINFTGAIDYDRVVCFVPEILARQEKLLLCKLVKETRREWDETGKKQVSFPSVSYGNPEKFWL